MFFENEFISIINKTNLSHFLNILALTGVQGMLMFVGLVQGCLELLIIQVLMSDLKAVFNWCSSGPAGLVGSLNHVQAVFIIYAIFKCFSSNLQEDLSSRLHNDSIAFKITPILKFLFIHKLQPK